MLMVLRPFMERVLFDPIKETVIVSVGAASRMYCPLKSDSHTFCFSPFTATVTPANGLVPSVMVPLIWFLLLLGLI
jgi:hypothetical protein